MAPLKRREKSEPPRQTAGWLTPNKILVLIMLLVLALRLVTIPARKMVQFDETAYLRMAENLAAGIKPWDISGLTDTHYAPLLPMFIAAFSFVVRDIVLSGYIVVALFGSLLVLPTYFLARELINPKVGLMAAALTGLTPIFLGTSEYIYSEMLYIFFMLSAVYYGWMMLKKQSPKCGGLAGLALGLAYLANPSALFYVVILLLLALVVAASKGGWGRLLVAAGVFLAAFALFAAPYVWYLHHELGRWTYSGKFIAGNIYSATYNIPRDNVKEWEKALLPLTDDGSEVKVLVLEADPTLNNPVNFILHYPVQAAKNFIKQVWVLHSQVLQQVFPLWLLPLVGLGLFGNGWDRRRALAAGYLVLMTLPVLLVLSMLSFPRFFMPFIPFGMIFAAQGWQKLEEWGVSTMSLAGGRAGALPWQKLVPVIAAAAVLLPVLGMGGLTLIKQSYSLEYKEAGQWVRENAGPGTKIMNREFSSAYYAGGVALVVPYDSYERTTAYARNKGADYMIISRKAIQDLRPGLKRLLEGDGGHPEWRLVHRVRPQTGSETYIFQLVK